MRVPDDDIRNVVNMKVLARQFNAVLHVDDARLRCAPMYWQVEHPVEEK